jgi:hypothetical protein
VADRLTGLGPERKTRPKATPKPRLAKLESKPETTPST